jgi:hypothetical protein
MKSRKAIILALMITLIAVAGVFWLGSRTLLRGSNFLWQSKDMIADVMIAEIAHVKSGGPVRTEVDYWHDETKVIWEMETNSTWLVNYTNMIVPMLVYEKITVGGGRYPRAVMFAPYGGSRSEHVSGSTYPQFGWVIVNERHLLDMFWYDRRDTLATLVHELIHVQGGAFLFGASEQLEAATSAATVEALAGMCNFGDNLACQAFWNNVEYTARNDLRARLVMMNRDDVYLKIAAILWQDEVEEKYTEKKARFWSENQDEFIDILGKYYFAPWRNTIIPGILYKSKVLNTMQMDEVEGHRVVLGMPYDDSSRLVGWFMKALMRVVVWQ